MSRALCQSILRLVGVLTVYFGIAWLAYTTLSYQGMQPWLTSLSQTSAKLAQAAGRHLGVNATSYVNNVYRWVLFGQLFVIILGILLVVWSKWIAGIIVKEHGQTTNA